MRKRKSEAGVEKVKEMRGEKTGKEYKGRREGKWERKKREGQDKLVCGRIQYCCFFFGDVICDQDEWSGKRLTEIIKM